MTTVNAFVKCINLGIETVIHFEGMCRVQKEERNDLCRFLHLFYYLSKPLHERTIPYSVVSFVITSTL